MCGILGIISIDSSKSLAEAGLEKSTFKKLLKLTERRGQDTSGAAVFSSNECSVSRYNSPISLSLKGVSLSKTRAFLAHGRMITNGNKDNQPVVKNECLVLHNGIITNESSLRNNIEIEAEFEIDSEILIDLYNTNKTTNSFSEAKGAINCLLWSKATNTIHSYSNTGDLFALYTGSLVIVASEEYTLKHINSDLPIPGTIVSLLGEHCLCDDLAANRIKVEDIGAAKYRVTKLGSNLKEEKLLIHRDTSKLKRCTKCILPETMPFISFNDSGECNYCQNYTRRLGTKSLKSLDSLVEPYRRKFGPEVVIPFSGGRDSFYALHLATKELGLKAITYTYDWGMVTDLARRNISNMTANLGIRNILVSANIEAKRKNVEMNLKAWLKAPHLGMISLLTAGDKHFFRYIEDVKRENNVSLNIWGVNPLETTHFKAGFLGIEPNFMESKVYNSNLMGQFDYQKKRFREYFRNPSYINKSIYDTLSGEYWRTVHKKTDYFHLFDYYDWTDEKVDNVLNLYDFERAPDTKSTWRIGDGTAAFYNYIYYNVAGFTENDTFRSNQIREGKITREEALKLVKEENLNRYPNIKWYLDLLGIDFSYAIKIINDIQPLY